MCTILNARLVQYELMQATAVVVVNADIAAFVELYQSSYQSSRWCVPLRGGDGVGC